MTKTFEQFNIVIKGVGGQGLITLLQIIAEAALSQGYEVRTSELHGLSQRGGSIEVHIRFGKKIYSPLIGQGKADLILGLEMQETMRGLYFAGEKTNFLMDKQIIPLPLGKSLSEKEATDIFKKLTKNVTIVPAAALCREKLGTAVVSGVYLMSLAIFKNLLPLKPNSILQAIKKVVPPQHLELNKKTFALAQKYAK